VKNVIFTVAAPVNPDSKIAIYAKERGRWEGRFLKKSLTRQSVSQSFGIKVVTFQLK